MTIPQVSTQILLGTCLLVFALCEQRGTQTCSTSSHQISYHVQIMSNDSLLQIVSLCQSRVGNVPSHILYDDVIESPHSIVSFDVHHQDNLVLYVTSARSLHLTTLSGSVVNNTQQVDTLNRYYLSPDNRLDQHTDLSTLILDLGTFIDLDPSQIVIDWTHYLLFTVANQQYVHVSSLLDQRATFTTEIVYRHSSTIKKIAICPSLSLIVWHEIEWSGQNMNTIMMAQMDGTNAQVMYQSASFIYDLHVDQVNQELYFNTNEYLGVIQMNSLQASSNKGGTVKLNVQTHQYTPISESKHFAIAFPFLIETQYDRISWHRLFYNKKYLFLTHKFSDMNSFIVSHEERQLGTRAHCRAQDCHDYCVPNGHMAKYSCFCYQLGQSCKDFGVHNVLSVIDDQQHVAFNEIIDPFAGNKNGEDVPLSTFTSDSGSDDAHAATTSKTANQTHQTDVTNLLATLKVENSTTTLTTSETTFSSSVWFSMMHHFGINYVTTIAKITSKSLVNRLDLYDRLERLDTWVYHNRILIFTLSMALTMLTLLLVGMFFAVNSYHRCKSIRINSGKSSDFNRKEQNHKLAKAISTHFSMIKNTKNAEECSKLSVSVQETKFCGGLEDGFPTSENKSIQNCSNLKQPVLNNFYVNQLNFNASRLAQNWEYQIPVRNERLDPFV